MNISTKILSLSVATIFAINNSTDIEACSRVVYIGDNGITITGRTLDWKEPIPTNLYIMPCGMSRTGFDTDNTVKWTSRYGSVVSVGYDMGVSEGLNEKGLSVNLLYLPGTVYTYPGDTRKLMSSSVWAQYVLDNFATTSEAVADLSKDVFRIDAPAMPGGSSTTLHMAISDPTGNSAIIEYINGKLNIHEGKQYQVLTNAPTFDKQLAVNEYWKSVNGENMLPGTSRSSDRFVRASFYVDVLPKNTTRQMALAGVMGIMRNVSVPLGITTHNQPEISSTQWRSIADQNEMVYYFEQVLSPAILWVDLKKVDLREGATVRKLNLSTDKVYVGDVTNDFKPSSPFKPFFRIPETAK